MKAVILAGGYGSRLSEETSVRPKPMVEIGGMPMLWHIMKIYASHGIDDFVICAGYKGDMIKDFFVRYAHRNSDLRIDLAAGTVEHLNKRVEPWTVTILDTGLGTATGGRIRRAREVIGDARFCFTYGDGLADVPVPKVIAAHEARGCLATLTAVRAPARFGALDLDDAGTRVEHFMEKGDGESWINGGFFVIEPAAIDYVQADNEMWEHAPMEKLVRDGQLGVYRHEGFWHCMDHLADKVKLEEMWQSGAPLEVVVMSEAFWHGRRVFVTGHTGFKGSWLSLWLHRLGAEVTGYALPPHTDPSLFETARVAACVTSVTGDIRVRATLDEALGAADPEVVFHLAAQPIVRESIDNPVETFDTNVGGTVQVLDAVRRLPSVRAVVVVTSDKCYENREVTSGYVETDPMGGDDPYSASKGCAELVTASFRTTYFSGPGTAAVASARAGNVIGGGDWAKDRLIPDIVAGFHRGEPVAIRYPDAVRPWQHVLEPLHGYLVLAQALAEGRGGADAGWNFGPKADGARAVSWICDRMADAWGAGAAWAADAADHPAETGCLTLDASRAARELGWAPRLDLDTALTWTVDWYRGYYGGRDARDLCMNEVETYEQRSA